VIVFILFITFAYFFSSLKNSVFKDTVQVLTGIGLVASVGIVQGVWGLSGLKAGAISLTIVFQAFSILIATFMELKDNRKNLSLFYCGILVFALIKNSNVYLFMSILIAITNTRLNRERYFSFIISILYFLNFALEFNSYNQSWEYSGFVQLALGTLFVIRNLNIINMKEARGHFLIMAFMLDLIFVYQLFTVEHMENMQFLYPLIALFSAMIFIYRDVMQRCLLILSYFIISGSAFSIYDLEGSLWVSVYFIIFPMVFTFIEDSKVKSNYRYLLNFLMMSSFLATHFLMIEMTSVYNSIVLIGFFLVSSFKQLFVGFRGRENFSAL